MRLTVIAAGIVIFAAFTLAVRYHFVGSGTRLKFWLLTAPPAVNMFVFVRELWRREKSMETLGAVLCIFVASAALFAWSVHASRAAHLKLIFEPDQPKGVLRSGPYHYIRHPFYASYMLFWPGCAIATLHPVNVGYFLVLVPVYVFSALKEEKGFKQSPSAADYEQYRRTAGLFWPKFR